MSDLKASYKFGLYGRCPVCKDITQEICEGCGATESFTDSSKPGIVICTECNLEHSIRCSKPGCGNQIKVLRTPKNADEKTRIDEFIYRKKNKDMDKRVFIIKETPKASVIKEVKVPVSDIKQKESEDLLILDTNVHIPQAVLPGSGTVKLVGKESPFQSSSLEDMKESVTPEIKPAPAAEKPVTATKAEEPVVISLKEETQKKTEKTPSSSPSPEEKQELDKIKNFWKTKELTEKEEKKEEERRIVNQFYDEQEDDALDKKINFENIYNETVYFDCKVCGKEEQKIVCDKCGQFNQFSLNYDALSCKCNNEIKVKTCSCGAKHGHSDFFLVSDGIKWQYSKSKSFYNYRKGRMLVFSTCPTCGVFSVEKCKVCGSKVNFGFPNRNNEVYCKNCGTVNQFLCENRNCNDTVKALKNPNSIEQQLEWLNEVMNFKTRLTSEKVKYAEPGFEKKPKPAAQEVSIGDDSAPDFTNSFIEEFDSKTKSIITSSFISEVEDEVKQRQKLQDELKNFNKTQVAPQQPAKPTFGAPSGSKPVQAPVGFGNINMENESSGPSVISFDDSASSKTKYIIIGIVAVVIIAAAYWVYSAFLSGDKGQVPAVQPVEEISPADSSSADTLKALSKDEKTDKNAAQTIIDAQKSNIDKAKKAVEANQKAAEDQAKQLEQIK
ncbi:MAG TPA: hypothetical protein PLK90_07145 [Clostridiales bacterium]|nr:hypothetical protein [Clostridiales bacterium]HQP70160.1 hypothetical protein [Clostridiales bacterium]